MVNGISLNKISGRRDKGSHPPTILLVTKLGQMIFHVV